MMPQCRGCSATLKRTWREEGQARKGPRERLLAGSESERKEGTGRRGGNVCRLLESFPGLRVAASVCLGWPPGPRVFL